MKHRSLAAVSDWHAKAARTLPRFAYDYLEGGAEDGRTAQANVDAYARIGFMPRTLVDVEAVDTQVRLFGETLSMPVAVGPTGLNGLFRHGADEQLAAAAGQAGIPFVLSTASTSPIERVVERTGGSLWLQLYVQNDRRIAERWMAKAAEHGFSVLMLTVDTPVAGTRNHYARNGFELPLRWTPRLLWDVLTHPRWCLETGIRGMPHMVNLARCAQETLDLQKQAGKLNEEMNRRLGWEDISWIRRHWKGPVLVKGINTVEDALLAHRHGADGVVISNHGGRQLEDAPLPTEVLPRVRDAVGDRLALLVDGGIRRGSSVAKAIALGASAVLLGRAPLYGVAVNGQAGVDAVLAILRKELETTLRLLGRPSVVALGADALAGRR